MPAFLGRILALFRMAGVVAALGYYLCILVVRMQFTNDKERLFTLYRKKYTGASLKILGVRTHLEGKIPSGTFLFVSNHRSMLDPFIQLNKIDAHIVSKAEVAKYPLVGFGARLTGVIYVERDAAHSRSKARESIRQVLVSGQSVLVYPEGTTSGLEGTLEFRTGAFAVAVDAKIPVVPLAIFYGHPGDSWSEGSLFMFFLRKFSKWRTHAYFSIGPEMSADKTPEELAVSAKSWIEGELKRIKGGEV